MTLSELIAALEAATGPSRELDEEIAKTQGWAYEKRNNDRVEWWYRPDGTRRAYVWRDNRCPPYTASLDAALTLVPEGLDWLLRTACGGTERRCYAHVMRGDTNRDGCSLGEGRHIFAAIALCIAALKARTP